MAQETIVFPIIPCTTAIFYGFQYLESYFITYSSWFKCVICLLFFDFLKNLIL